MAKVKYYYDSETLSYRPIPSSKRLKISNLFLFLISSLLFGVIGLFTLLNTEVIKTPKEIELKLQSYLHHREFDVNPLSVNQIDEIIKNKQAIYDLKVDKTDNKIGNGNFLKKFELNKLPEYIISNQNKFSDWID